MAGYRQMEKAYKEGKVRAIGLSNFKKEQIEEILSICEVKPAVLQTELHPTASSRCTHFRKRAPPSRAQGKPHKTTVPVQTAAGNLFLQPRQSAPTSGPCRV